VSGVLQIAVSGGFNEGKAKAIDISSQIVSESISSIRTILTLGDEAIIERYTKALNCNYDSMVRKSNIAGLFFGLSFMILFITIALIFYLVSVYTQ
jgi:ABC-type multidrug transport system fused ATPase/permease subunit